MDFFRIVKTTIHLMFPLFRIEEDMYAEAEGGEEAEGLIEEGKSYRE